MQDGYSKLHRLTLEARADMLESVAGMDSYQVTRELAFAAMSLDESDPAALRWMACLCERRVEDLEVEVIVAV